MDLLKLIALDEDDLKIISAHLQDAILRVDEMNFAPRDKRFAAVLRRFDWAGAEAKRPDTDEFERRQCALRFERVKRAQYKNFVKNGPEDAVLELLAIDFEPQEEVAGFVTLIFAGGGAIRLEVDCIEAELRDLGPVWKTKFKPEHVESAREVKQGE